MIKTTYRRQGDGTFAYDYYTKERMPDGDIKLVGWGKYGSSSVLSGQSMKAILSWFKTDSDLDAALVEAGINPGDVNWSNKWMEPTVSLTHLSDEGDY